MVKVLRLSTEAGEAYASNVDRIPLFYIDDREYTVPKDVDAGIALRYLDVVAELGQEVGLVRLFKELVGEEPWRALLAFKGLKPAELTQLLEAVAEHAMDVVQEVQGK